MSEVQVTVYGGAGEIGGNRILLEWDGAGWLLDFGIRFGATGNTSPSSSSRGRRRWGSAGLPPDGAAAATRGSIPR